MNPSSLTTGYLCDLLCAFSVKSKLAFFELAVENGMKEFLLRFMVERLGSQLCANCFP